jgi:serine/threonine protein kinase
MEYLHQKKIVHFDLKSANLLLGYRDRRAVCKVADFGLSKQKHDTYVSNVTSQRGTLPWIAPEIIKTPHAVNEKVRTADSDSASSPTLLAKLACQEMTWQDIAKGGAPVTQFRMLLFEHHVYESQ